MGHCAQTNNTVRHRITVALTFLAWCNHLGVPTADLTRLRRLKRSDTKVYGKAQSANPGRWLTHDEAYGALVAVCQDGTLIGRPYEGPRHSGCQPAGVRACCRGVEVPSSMAHERLAALLDGSLTVPVFDSCRPMGFLTQLNISVHSGLERP